MSLGVVLTGGVVGTNAMGEAYTSTFVVSDNVLDDYSVIYLDGSPPPSGTTPVLFRCATGLGPSGTDDNNGIGDLYYNDMVLPEDTCSGLLQAGGVGNVVRFPGIYNGRWCSALTTSTEGVYTCTLTNSSNMP